MGWQDMLGGDVPNDWIWREWVVESKHLTRNVLSLESGVDSSPKSFSVNIFRVVNRRKPPREAILQTCEHHFSPPRHYLSSSRQRSGPTSPPAGASSPVAYGYLRVFMSVGLYYYTSMSVDLVMEGHD